MIKMQAGFLKQSSLQNLSEMADQSHQIIFKSEQFELNIKLASDDCIHFEMFISLPEPDVYTCTLHNYSLPPDVSNAFQNVEMLFECLKYPFDILPQIPAIKAKAQYVFKSKKIVKEATIKLNKQSFTKEELLNRKIAYLRSHFQSLQKSSIGHDIYEHWQAVTVNPTNIKIQICDDCLNQESGLERIFAISKRASEKISAVVEQFDELRQKTQVLTLQISQICNSSTGLYEEINKLKTTFKLESLSKQIGKSDLPFDITKSNDPEIQQVIQQEKVTLIPQKSCKQERMPPLVRKPGLQNFLISGLTIIHTGPEKKGGHQIAIDYQMKVNSARNKFKIKIDKTEQSHIYIGIIPSTLIGLQRTNQVIAYLGIDGEIWDSHEGKKIGSGFKQGDVVQVQIFTAGIQWKVNNITVVKHKTTKLKNKQRIFYPFIEMVGTGDCVQWVPL